MSCRYANAKYMTIAERIVERFRAGEFQSDGQFYSRDELAKAYHIAQGTATSVLKVLEDRNIISCRKGKRAIVIVLGSSTSNERDDNAARLLEDALGAIAW